MSTQQEENPNWTQLRADVLRKLSLLQAAWEHTAKTPDLHEPIKRDLYLPAIRLLAEFCTCVTEEEEFSDD